MQIYIQDFSTYYQVFYNIHAFFMFFQLNHIEMDNINNKIYTY